MAYMGYLPPYFEGIVEIEQIGDAFDLEMVTLQNKLSILPNDAAITTASESRLTEWEKILAIIPQERTIEQRRMMILATLRGTGKLNEDKIKTIVKTFSGGGCLVSFNNSKITVKISPPEWGEIFLFPDVEKALKPLIPAHLGLSVERYYNTWADRKKQHPTWGDLIAKNLDWATIKNKVEAI
ncbi:MAG: putative phage tail protein [Clostridiales bacterium]